MTKSDSSEGQPRAPSPSCSMASNRRPTSKRFANRICRSRAGSARRAHQGLSQTGGHLGPNLGVVELTIALHRVFDTPRTSFVFDVSHQGYVHKMLTGRRDRIQHDAPIPGAQWLSAAHRKRARLLWRGPRRHRACPRRWGWPSAATCAAATKMSSCVAGDAAFTCGISYEALNNVAVADTKRFIVVLNDNEWSIAKNVGAIASYLNNIATNPTYADLHDKARHFIEKIGGKRCGRLRAQSRGGREEPDRAERDLRGIRLSLLRPDRRARHSAAHPRRSSF